MEPNSSATTAGPVTQHFFILYHCLYSAWFSGNHFWFERCFNKSYVICDIQICFCLQGPYLQLSHVRSAFGSDWWINCGFWRRGLCRKFSGGLKTAPGTQDWHPTLPTTAPSRQLPPGWRSNLDRRSDLDPSSCAACHPGVSAARQGAGSGHHGGMSAKWWQASWAALEPATKSQFWRCKCNDALVRGIPQWKSRMRVFYW